MRRLDIDPTSLLAQRTDILEEPPPGGVEEPRPIPCTTHLTFARFLEVAEQFSGNVVVAKRLPFGVKGDGEIVPPAGGAARAIARTAVDFGPYKSTLIGLSPSEEHGRVAEAVRRHGSRLKVVEQEVSPPDWEKGIEGWANETVWPNLHGLPYNYTPGSFESNENITADLAVIVLRVSNPGDAVVIHDFQIERTAAHARRLSTDPELQGRLLAHFSHTCQPSPDEFAEMPHAKEVARARLAYNIWGLQTYRDLEKVVALNKEAFPDIQVTTTRDRHVQLTLGGETVDLFVAPIGVDVEGLQQEAEHPAVKAAAERICREHPNQVIIASLFRVDDPTKYGDLLIEGFGEALDKNPELLGRVTLVIGAQTSRQAEMYQRQVDRFEEVVKAINERFGTDKWQPVEVKRGGVYGDERDGLFSAADVLVDPAHRQGMGLTTMEHYTVRGPGGVQVAGEEVGANTEMKGNIQFNPRHPGSLADALVEALTMPAEERFDRYHRSSGVLRNTNQTWGEGILTAANRARDRRNLWR